MKPLSFWTKWFVRLERWSLRVLSYLTVFLINSVFVATAMFLLQYVVLRPVFHITVFNWWTWWLISMVIYTVLEIYVNLHIRVNTFDIAINISRRNLKEDDTDASEGDK